MTKRFVPDWITKVRFLANYYLSGCSAPWGAYAEKAQPQALETVMILTTLSAADIVKEFFRPQGLRSARHGRKGRKSRGSVGGIPDPNEMFARTLRGDLDFNGIKYNLPTAVFYVVDDVIDRIFYTVLIVELATDIAYEAVLGLLEVDKTFCPSIGRMWRTNGFLQEGGPATGWQNMGQGSLRYTVKVFSPNQFIFGIDNGTYSITMGARITSARFNTRVKFRIQTVAPLIKTWAESDWIEVRMGETSDVIINAVIEVDCGVVIEYIDEGGFWEVVRSDLMVLEIV
ncbi:MAG: hypothetical protein ACRCYS_02295 [Beijerinckiaceae bacterium]